MPTFSLHLRGVMRMHLSRSTQNRGHMPGFLGVGHIPDMIMCVNKLLRSWMRVHERRIRERERKCVGERCVCGVRLWSREDGDCKIGYADGGDRRKTVCGCSDNRRKYHLRYYPPCMRALEKKTGLQTVVIILINTHIQSLSLSLFSNSSSYPPPLTSLFLLHTSPF